MSDVPRRTETLTWIPVTEQLPDADTTVFLYTPNQDEPTWVGWYDGVYWFGIDDVEYEDGDVVAWAELPGGPANV